MGLVEAARVRLRSRLQSRIIFSAALAAAQFVFRVPLFGCSLAEASPRQDFYIDQAFARYFTLPDDARTLGTAGSAAALCEGAACAYLNPAELGRMRRPEVSLEIGARSRDGIEHLTERDIEQTQEEGFAVAALPIGASETETGYGTVAFGYSRYEGETNDSIHTSPDGHRRTISYGLAASDTARLGYSFTFYDDQLRSDEADLHSTSRILHLFGLTLAPSDRVEVGAVFKLGIGQSDTEDFSFGTDGVSHLRQYTGALTIARRFELVRALVGADFTSVDSEGNLEPAAPEVVVGEDEDGESTNIRLGAEYFFTESFRARAGARYHWTDYTLARSDLTELGGRTDGPSVAAGIGYSFDATPSHPGLRLDYGIEYTPTGGKALRNLVTVSLPW